MNKAKMLELFGPIWGYDLVNEQWANSGVGSRTALSEQEWLLFNQLDYNAAH